MLKILAKIKWKDTKMIRLIWIPLLWIGISFKPINFAPWQFSHGSPDIYRKFYQQPPAPAMMWPFSFCPLILVFTFLSYANKNQSTSLINSSVRDLWISIESSINNQVIFQILSIDSSIYIAILRKKKPINLARWQFCHGSLDIHRKNSTTTIYSIDVKGPFQFLSLWF